MALEGQPSLIEYDGGFLVADALIDSSENDAWQYTQLAVEDGSTISDHRIQIPRGLTLNLIQTETPIAEIEGFAKTVKQIDVRTKEFRPTSLLALQNAAQDKLFGDNPSAIKVTVLEALTPVARVNDFHLELLDLAQAATPLTITIKGRSILGMRITSITRTETPGEFGASRFSVALQRINTVTAETTELPAVPAARSKQSRGGKPAKPNGGGNGADGAAANKSLAAALLDAGG